jgi:hypothetical protein
MLWMVISVELHEQWGNHYDKRSKIAKIVRCLWTILVSSDLLLEYFIYNSLNSEPITLDKMASQLRTYGAYIHILISSEMLMQYI